MSKILYVITKSSWGGATKYVFDLVQAAQERGFEVLVAAGGEGELVTRLQQVGVKVIPLPHLVRDIKPWADFLTFFDLLKIFKQERPDIVHLNSSKIGAIGALATRIYNLTTISYKLKAIFTGHGWAFNEQRFFLGRWLIALGHWVTILLCHQTIAVSKITAKQISIFPFVKNKIIVIYNGLNAPTFVPKLEARNKLAPEDKDTIWLGTIAELHKNKGLDILLIAFKQVLARIGGLTLIIIGEGEERANLAHLIAQYQLTPNVRLLGRVANAATYLPALDLFILPSRTEALPYVILEAGLANLPVIASRVGGIPEIIDDQTSGLLITAGNYKELALAIEKLLTHQDLAKTYGQNLKQKILNHFSSTQMLDQTFVLYKK